MANANPGGGTGGPSSVSPKVTASTLAAAITTIVWFFLGMTIAEDLDADQVAALTGATATILAFVLGYVIRDPARG